MVVIAVGCGSPAGENPNIADEVRQRFESEYRHAPPPDPYSSRRISAQQREHLDNVIELGPRVLPLLVEKLAETRNIFLNYPIGRISRKLFLPAEWPAGRRPSWEDQVDMWPRWWEAGAKGTSELFEERAQFCLEWWEKNKDWWTIPFPQAEAAVRTRLTAPMVTPPAASQRGG